MTRRQQRMLGIGVLVVGIGAAAALTLTAFRKNLMNFYTPSDLVTSSVPTGGKLRLGGLVERGSVKRLDGLKVEFVLADCTSKVAVRYEGILPDLFREGQGIVTTGSLSENRIFVAEEVLAKHDENYMPPQLAESLQTPAGHSCMPFKSLSFAPSPPRRGRGLG